MAEINGGDPNYLLTGMILQEVPKQPYGDIPWNAGWFIGILILAYYNPYIPG